MSIVHRPRLFTPPMEDFAKVPQSRDTWATWDDEADASVRIALPEPPAWRSILVTNRDEVLDVAEGEEVGLVDGLVNLAQDAHVVAIRAALADGMTLAEAVAESDDQVVWENGRVLAILRPLADGSIEVAHFNPTGFLDAIGGGR